MITPVGKHVLVKAFEVEEVDETFKMAKEAGIYIPKNNEMHREQRSVDRGKVVAVSDNAWKDWFDGSPWCQVGDTVMFAKFGGKVVKDSDDVEYVLLNDEDVLAVFK